MICGGNCCVVVVELELGLRLTNILYISIYDVSRWSHGINTSRQARVSHRELGGSRDGRELRYVGAEHLSSVGLIEGKWGHNILNPY